MTNTAAEHKINVASEKPSQMVIEAIADFKGVDSTELSPSLFSVIDPDALDSLFRSPTNKTRQTEGHVCFTFSGCDVVVQSDDGITVTKA